MPFRSSVQMALWLNMWQGETPKEASIDKCDSTVLLGVQEPKAIQQDKIHQGDLPVKAD